MLLDLCGRGEEMRRLRQGGCGEREKEEGGRMHSRDKRKREEKQSERTVTVRINAFLLEGGGQTHG